MATPVPIAVRSSNGLTVNSGLPHCKQLEGFTPIVNKAVRTTLFSPEGKYFAIIQGNTLKILHGNTLEDHLMIENTKAYHVAFSPKSTYLMTWEHFVTNNANPQGTPNLHIYRCEDGTLVKSFVEKKQTNWEPQWSGDENIFSRMVNTDVVFYEGCNFEKIVHRLSSYKIGSYSLSPTVGTHYVLCHVPGKKGQPSFGKLFKYPNFEPTQAIASKSYFQADKVEFFWNNKGTHALLLTSTEVDKTGGSYYGKQGLNFITVTGETSLVSLGKEGPIYSVAWSPKGNEFCVVFGFTPAKAAVYNLKGEMVFDMGSGSRNSVYYSPHGNILLLGGFGNLRGQIELWDMTTRKLIGKTDAPDSTLLDWSPDGKHFLTATTAPRLRIGNGFKIWHYSGTLLFEKAAGEQEEFYEVFFKKVPKDSFPEPKITSEKVKGIESSQPQASKEAYRPPSARNKVINFKLHDDEEFHKPSGESAPSKAAMKQRKKREARKARKAEEGDEAPAGKESGPAPVVSSVHISLTGDPEKDKKIKTIKKKLDAIEKLKEQQAQGKPLEVNQLAKITGEKDLVKELQQLQI